VRHRRGVMQTWLGIRLRIALGRIAARLPWHLLRLPGHLLRRNLLMASTQVGGALLLGVRGTPSRRRNGGKLRLALLPYSRVSSIIAARARAHRTRPAVSCTVLAGR
jgi:hypothetical protein